MPIKPADAPTKKAPPPKPASSSFAARPSAVQKGLEAKGVVFSNPASAPTSRALPPPISAPDKASSPASRAVQRPGTPPAEMMESAPSPHDPSPGAPWAGASDGFPHVVPLGPESTSIFPGIVHTAPGQFSAPILPFPARASQGGVHAPTLTQWPKARKNAAISSGKSPHATPPLGPSEEDVAPDFDGFADVLGLSDSPAVPPDRDVLKGSPLVPGAKRARPASEERAHPPSHEGSPQPSASRLGELDGPPPAKRPAPPTLPSSSSMGGKSPRLPAAMPETPYTGPRTYVKLRGWWETPETLRRNRLWALEGMCNFPGCPLQDRHGGPHQFCEEAAAMHR